jgi:glycosyltransferase involved in cell wall biosynthesis
MGGTVYYVGEFHFPHGEAASYRVLGNALAIQAAGFAVKVIGRDGSLTEKVFGGQPNTHQGILYDSVNEYGARSAPQLYRAWRFLRGGSRLVQWLATHARHDASALILAGGYSRYLFRLLPLTRRWNIPLVVDVVEWFEPTHCLGGRFGPQRWDVEIAMRRMIPASRNVIAVSSFLEDHFIRRGSRVLRGPLVDVTDAKWRALGQPVPDDCLRIAFVGNAGRKDLLVNAIRGLALLGDDARNWDLVMVGPSRSEVVRNLGADANLLERLNGAIHFLGSVSHAEALAHLKQADFSILLRPDLRFAHAGFPTKLVESLAMGVPVICNLTSDIGLYVRDGQEGLVVPDCSPIAFASGLRRAMALSLEQRMVMRANARRRAEVSFDYRNWSEPLGEFMQQVIGSRQGRK